MVWNDEFDQLNIGYSEQQWSPRYEVWDAIVLDGNSERCAKESVDYIERMLSPADEVLPLHKVSNGALHLYAHEFKSNNGSDKYESICGMIDGSNLHSQSYGYWEIRVKIVNVSIGQHIAFWLVPKEGGTPPEIDLLEVVGSNAEINTDINRLHFTGHYASKEAGEKGIAHTMDYVKVDDVKATWHTVGLEWTPEHVTWYLGGKRVHQMDASLFGGPEVVFLASPETSGRWPGLISDSTVWPMEVMIDYVRIYKRNEELDRSSN